MTIYDKDKLDDNIHIQKKTPNPQIYMLCDMGAELEGVVEGIIGAVGTVGTDTQPVKLVEGVCTPVTNPLVDTATDQDVDGTKNFLDNPKGATAESGAVDTSLINANWASQTGNSAPNNFIHKTGDETKTGNFTVDGFEYSPHPFGGGERVVSLTTVGATEWFKVYEADISGNEQYGDDALILLVSYLRRSAGDNNADDAIGILTVSYRSTAQIFNWLVAGEDIDVSRFKLTKKYDSTTGRSRIIIWCKVDTTTNRYGFVKLFASRLTGFSDAWVVSSDNNVYSEPTIDDFDIVKTSTIMTLKTS